MGQTETDGSTEATAEDGGEKQAAVNKALLIFHIKFITNEPLDLRDFDELEESLNKLAIKGSKYVLGSHKKFEYKDSVIGSKDKAFAQAGDQKVAKFLKEGVEEGMMDFWPMQEQKTRK